MAAPRYSRRRRRPARGLLFVLLLAAAIYVLVTGGFADGRAGQEVTGGTRAEGGLAVNELLDDVTENGDGSITVDVSEGQTAALVAAGLARSSAPTLRDVAVDLVTVDEGPPGRMIVTGRLADQPVPVRATIDLEVVDSSVRPTVRDARIGPLGMPSSVRRDLNRQLRDLVGVAAQGIVVSDLRTTDTALVLTGSRI
jgi:hypothetical protein